MVKAKASGVTRDESGTWIRTKDSKRNPLRSRYLSGSYSNRRKLVRSTEGDDEATVVLTTPEEFALYDDLKKRMDAEMVRRGMRKA